MCIRPFSFTRIHGVLENKGGSLQYQQMAPSGIVSIDPKPHIPNIGSSLEIHGYCCTRADHVLLTRASQRLSASMCLFASLPRLIFSARGEVFLDNNIEGGVLFCCTSITFSSLFLPFSFPRNSLRTNLFYCHINSDDKTSLACCLRFY